MRLSQPDYRGCPFINAAAEYPGPGVVAEQIAAHRARVRRLFVRLLGVKHLGQRQNLVEQLLVVYDGAMVAAQLDATAAAAAYARTVAASLLGQEDTMRLP